MEEGGPSVSLLDESKDVSDLDGVDGLSVEHQALLRLEELRSHGDLPQQKRERVIRDFANRMTMDLPKCKHKGKHIQVKVIQD